VCKIHPRACESRKKGCMKKLNLREVIWLMFLLTYTGCSLVTGTTSTGGPSDGAISKEVEAKLAGDQFGGLSDILVTTEAGVVTLVGKVEKAEQKARAADLARQVKGVKRVKNDLDIRRTIPEENSRQ
jgi:hyperosmotically inducible protein